MNTSKIIKGVVGGGRYTVTAPIIKEDYGLYLQIEGIELPETYQVDFSNDEHSGTSVTMVGNADGVLIPSQFISSGKDVFAFLYHVGADYGRTVYKFRIPNKLRPDRTDEEPTPEEQSVIDQTISALNDAVDRAEDAEQAIENMSVSAQTLAEGESATVTKSEQEGVVHLEFGIPRGATGAQGERGEKGEKGDRGEQGIQGIQGERGLTGAKGDKGDKGDAGAKGDKGDRGDTGEQGIQGEKGEKGDKGDKGDTGASGRDGTDGVSPTVSVTDITGGHKVTITDKSGTKSFDVMDGDDYALTEQDKQDIADIAEADLTPTILNAFPTDTALGSIASFPDGADGLPLKSLGVDIEPVQGGSGDPSPTNIRPISGWNGVNVMRTGKNLFNVPASVTKGYITFTRDSDGYVTANPNNADSRSWGKDNAQFLVNLAPGNYKFVIKLKTPSASQYSGWEIYSPTGSKIAGSSGGKFRADEVAAFTASAYGTYYIMAKIHSSASRFMVVKDGVDTSDYSPYTEQTIPINFGQTVYGGKLDVLTGKLTVDRAYAVFDGSSDERWQKHGTIASWFYTDNAFTNVFTDTSASNFSISNAYKQSPYSTVANIENGKFAIGYSSGSAVLRTVFKDTRYTTVQEWTDALATNHIQLCYKLATPIVYDLTPTEVKTLLGANNIFANTGDTEVEYRADPDLYIQRKMPEVPVDDVQINGQSIVSDGVANIPMPKTVNVSGTTPTIAAQADTRYVCGEIATLDFTPSATGICDVVFTSGSTPTVVTLPSTVKFPDGAFTAEADTTYEINILDGVYGAVMAWT